MPRTVTPHPAAFRPMIACMSLTTWKALLFSGSAIFGKTSAIFGKSAYYENYFWIADVMIAYSASSLAVWHTAHILINSEEWRDNPPAVQRKQYETEIQYDWTARRLHDASDESRIEGVVIGTAEYLL